MTSAHLESPRKQRLRKLLDTPIKFGKIPEGPEREAFVAAETEKRINAAFDLYDIDAATPESAKWMALALYMLGEHFRGCRSLAKQPGGSPKNSSSAYLDALAEFDAYCATAPAGTAAAHAKWFLKSRGGSIQIGAEKISSGKSFMNMYRREKKGAL
jgi:hypothetical protein